MPEVRTIGKLNLLPRDVAAEKLGVTGKTLRNWERDHRGPPVVRVGHKVFYEEASVERWLARSISKAEAAE
jgi:predicted site-specific integrase-resolvase